jgi:hypothetical protein
MERRSHSPAAVLVLALGGACGGGAPLAATSSAPADAPEAAERPGSVEERPPSEGRKVWEVIPNAPHGQCCESDQQCGAIECEPYEYAHRSCQRVCTYSCEPGDLCPRMGGTFGPPISCPASGLCPVGPPHV